MERERIWTTELGQHVGETVRLAGWLHHWRRLSQVGFLVLRDAKGLAQIVVEEPAVIARLSALPHESVVAVTGIVTAQPRAPGGVELHHPSLEVVTAACAPPPFDLFRPMVQAQLPTMLDHAALALRHPRQRAVFQIADAAMAGYRSTLRALDFVEIQTPKLVASATEGGANVVAVDYFGRQAFLAQSPQFYKQIMVGVFERVFEVGPVFRAEPHDTPRHLNEYVSLDAEMGFIADHTTVMALLTRVLAGTMASVADRAAGALWLLDIGLPAVPNPIPCLHFTDAQAVLAAATGEDVWGEPDLSPAHERWLGDWALREHGSAWLFVTGFPLSKRPFYTHPDPHRAGPSNGFDLLFRGLELVTGGATPASLRGLSGGVGGARDGQRPVRRASGSIPPWDAAARRVRHWSGAAGGAARRRGEHPGNHALPARSAPSGAVMG